MNVSYVRVSTSQQEHAAQAASIRAAIGGEPEKTYEDVGSGFKSIRRPGLDALLDDAASGKLKGAVLWIFALSRLTRKGTYDALDTILRLEAAGVAVRSVTEPMINTSADNPFRDVLISLFATVGKMESTAKSDRVKAWHQMKRERGERTGRRPKPFDLDRFRALVAQDASIYAISKELKISPKTVRRYFDKGLHIPPISPLRTE